MRWYRLRIKRMKSEILRNTSPILTKPKREEKKLSSGKIRFLRNPNNQTSVFEVSNLGEVSLNSVAGISCLLGPLVECHVHRVPLLPHLVVAGVNHRFDLIAHVLGGCALGLGSLNVVVAVFGPSLWH